MLVWFMLMLPATLAWYYCRPWGHPLTVAPAVLRAELSPSQVASYVDPHGHTCYVYRDPARFESYMESRGWYACDQMGGGLTFCNSAHTGPYDQSGTYWLGRDNGQCHATQRIQGCFGLLKAPYLVCEMY